MNEVLSPELRKDLERVSENYDYWAHQFSGARLNWLIVKGLVEEWVDSMGYRCVRLTPAGRQALAAPAATDSAGGER